MYDEKSIPQKLEILLGGSYNNGTRLGEEFQKNDFISRYEQLQSTKPKKYKYPSDTFDSLCADIKSEILNSGYSMQEIWLAIEQYRYTIAASKKYGAFKNSSIAICLISVINVLIYLAVLLDTIGIFSISQLFEKVINWPISLVVIIGTLFLLFLPYILINKRRAYQKNTDKYFDFLLHYLFFIYKKGTDEAERDKLRKQNTVTQPSRCDRR